MKVKLLNKIAPIGLKELNGYEIGENVTGEDGIMVRSAVMHEMEFDQNLKAIARAGAGVNNIPIDRCSEKGIVVFNTPGANANGVKELAICALLLASRDIVGGINWANTLTEDVAKAVEKGKSKFAGTEIKGKTLGVIGLGAIGGMLANVAVHLGMQVIGCDPFLSVQNAWNLNNHIIRADSYDEIYAKADYITIHVPATKDTKEMICNETIAKMKDGVKLLNLARADLVNLSDLKDAISSGKISAYVTDFPTEETVNVPGIITIPHLGASTEEAEDNCAIMAAKQLDDYLKNGNIVNSVNYPTVEMQRSGEARICALHANIPSVLMQITASISSEGLNIENLTNKSKGENAYTIIDVSKKPSEEVLSKIRAIEGMRMIRSI